MKEFFQLVKAYRANRKEAIRDKRIHELAVGYSQQAIDTMVTGLSSSNYTAIGLPRYADQSDYVDVWGFLENWVISYHCQNPKALSPEAMKHLKWAMDRHTCGQACPIHLLKTEPGWKGVEMGLLTNEHWWKLVKLMRDTHVGLVDMVELVDTGRLAVWRATVKKLRDDRAAAERQATEKALLLRAAEAIEDSLNKDLYGLGEYQLKFMCSTLFRIFGFAEAIEHSFTQNVVMQSIDNHPTLLLYMRGQGLIHPNLEMGMHDSIILGKQHYRKLIRELREKAAAL